MGKRLNTVWNLLRHYKYPIVIVVGIAIVGFIDENSYMQCVRYDMQIDDLHGEINKYTAQHNADVKKLKELRKDPKAIEKIARERYFMKADDEDIYVLDDDENAINDNNETTE